MQIAEPMAQLLTPAHARDWHMACCEGRSVTKEDLMADLLWKVNLPAGRIASVSEHGAYVVLANETKDRWTAEFTYFPSDADSHVIPACPRRRFSTWVKACEACAKHADVCGELTLLMRA